MAFVSGSFLVFLFVVFTAYFLTPKKYQWVVLLIASYTFYAFSGVKLLFFLVLTTLVTFMTGRLLGKVNQQTSQYLAAQKKNLSREEKKEYKNKQTTKKRRILFYAVLVNLGILIFLKYFNFLAGNVNSVISMFGSNAKIPVLNLLLPLGISFYTLQSIAYVVDVYRGKYEPDGNIAKFALFMSYFPQIVQGPIARYDQLAHQLYESHKFEYNRVTQGAQLILWGFIKKLVIADRLAVIVNPIFDNYQNYGGILLFIAAAGYGFQVYADFSGGMDIARGVSQILGIDLVLNFERPYFARSLAEFWRRWHITLGSWMKDYVFYPLSLSKQFSKLGKATRKILGNYIGKKLPTFLSMFIVFMLVGVWHGSSWKYVGYGLWNAVIIVSSILLEPFYISVAQKFKVNTECFGWRFFQMVRTFLICSFGRFFSRGLSFLVAVDMIKRTFTEFNPWVLFDGTLLNLGLSIYNILVLIFMIIVMLIVGNLQEKGIHIRESIARQNLYFRWMIYLGALILVLVFGIYGPGYSAAEFIYQQF